MNTYLFSATIICAITGKQIVVNKEYRASNQRQAIKGFNQYLQDNKTVKSVLDSILIKRL